jgi:hypothetical protein
VMMSGVSERAMLTLFDFPLRGVYAAMNLLNSMR